MKTEKEKALKKIQKLVENLRERLFMIAEEMENLELEIAEDLGEL